ncbi:SDR family NAD(P)-dependent oxidoreductase [Flavivirga eckloniae]|uniref:Short-chain dehydrogenase n=1 Tax=Flavivirga eckloniae TaxID=1803846 RepID=A0A2K9PX21_9FLAO|nr:SDR family oxidoreductase [Flavivirga eckloniae]AUP81611.1 short-chain dehydrogenase [Flavivirga eckloniae]
MRLKNKVAVVTGGNSGIGLGIAKEFDQEGAVGSIVGRNLKTIETAVAALRNNFMGIQTDVTNIDQLESIFSRTTDKYGKIDILVVNAGGAIGNGSLGSLESTTEEDFDRMVDLNLKSVFFTVQKSLPYLNNGASIILVASIATQKAFDGLTVYSAAKAGVRSFSRTFSRDLLKKNIRVNTISPGTIDTPLFGKLGLSNEVALQAKENFASLIPVERIGQPSDIGKAAVYLASSESSFVIGEEISIDGGVVNF